MGFAANFGKHWFEIQLVSRFAAASGTYFWVADGFLSAQQLNIDRKFG